MSTLLNLALALLKSPKAIASGATVALGLNAGGGYLLIDYVNTKHDKAIHKIELNAKSVTELNLVAAKKSDATDQADIAATQKVMAETLNGIRTQIKTVSDGVKANGAQIKETRDRVWQISRDVYLIKQRGG